MNTSDSPSFGAVLFHHLFRVAVIFAIVMFALSDFAAEHRFLRWISTGFLILSAVSCFNLFALAGMLRGTSAFVPYLLLTVAHIAFCIYCIFNHPSFLNRFSYMATLISAIPSLAAFAGCLFSRIP